VSPYWIGILRYLTWGLVSITPAIFAPRHLPVIVVIPALFAWVIASMAITGFLWRGLATAFGWELPIEDDDDDEISN
jgi:uncharacterized membrane protein YeiH